MLFMIAHFAAQCIIIFAHTIYWFDLDGVSEILGGGRASYLKIDFKPITKPLPPLVQQLPD